ncbi:cell wall hydrolase [Novosphingobium sp. 1949]|uniref:Cell wall hydrolase n=1 Tax=Novosphingobium organovorum TaxID=2930092 RepID=A0ABT0BF47_9SPHN|nr:cell wall hydrolase [Novosphingobium organovorum]MCJ2183406.1 cell wall hydrolase [Novosphingobium organovorum]
MPSVPHAPMSSPAQPPEPTGPEQGGDRLGKRFGAPDFDRLLVGERRPSDFHARFTRRPRGVRRAAATPAHGRNRTLAAALLAAIALPAFASPGGWDRFSIANAEANPLQLDPMPFEQPGSSFPGSAFYYLQPDAPTIGAGIAGRNGADAPGILPDPGPAAHPLHILDVPFISSPLDRSRALQCLTSAIYYEAASEPDAGQRAVAQVVLNRVAHPAYPATVCGVVFEGSDKPTSCQFSFTCDGSMARKPSPYFWDRAEAVARAALSGAVYAPVGLATHYHTLQVHPYWAPSLHPQITIGAHEFYRFNGAAGSPATFSFLYAGHEPSAAPRPPSLLARAPQASDAALDPVTVQNNFDSAHRLIETAPPVDEAHPNGSGAQGTVTSPRDTLAPALDNLPQASGIKEKYQNSGRWIKTP